MPTIDRRQLIGSTALLWIPALARPAGAETVTEGPHDSFPAVEYARVLETVRYAHVDLERVESLVTASPSLANATVDWGFGDWESAVGAAAHMGRGDIAELLLAHGARPDLFTHAMLGHLPVVRSAVEARPGIQRELGPHGFTLLHHARAGGDQSKPVVEYLETLGDADPKPSTKPLPRDASDYVGDYLWSDGPDDRVTVTERDGDLSLGYGEGFPRTLFHLGDHAFYPTGAANVRIRFAFQGDRVELSVHDPGVILRAAKAMT